MAERIHETLDESGRVSHRTIETGSSSSGGGGMLFVLLAGILLAVGAYFLFANSSETRKDDAIAGAAKDVGDAAQKAGDAVDKAADKIAN